ncbi:DUF2730 family protein [Rhizobium sp.]|uniref:DUF2730 family protein n=1 Tax=Rhizobium sp. TaxID=391 RepID=UPI003F810F31
MDIQTFVIWSTAILSVVSILGHLKTFFGSGEATNSKTLEGHGRKLIDLDRRVQKVENDLTHMPDAETAHRLEITLERIAGRLDTMDERIKPIAATNLRLQDYLLEHGDK